MGEVPAIAARYPLTPGPSSLIWSVDEVFLREDDWKFQLRGRKYMTQPIRTAMPTNSPKDLAPYTSLSRGVSLAITPKTIETRKEKSTKA